MEIGQLIAFERVARDGSFTRAADALDLTQPTISARIAGLEKHLGGKLFDRRGRYLKLTTLGETFLPYAERALAILVDGKNAAHHAVEGRLGNVNIATLAPLGYYMLADPIQQFRAEYPSVDLAIHVRTYGEILNMIQDGAVTLGLIIAPVWDKSIQILRLYQDPLRWVAPADHALVRRQNSGEVLTVADLHGHTIFRVGLNPRASAMVEGIVENARRGSGGAFISLPSTMAVEMMFGGEGVAYLPESLVEPHIDSGRLTLLHLSNMPLAYYEPLVVTQAGRTLDRPNTAFVEMIRRRWAHLIVSR